MRAPKYLNSRETPLFGQGGRALYNHGPARSGRRAGGSPLVVAEGYMDVIALGGPRASKRAVAPPWATAITEEQLQMLWRISPEPVIALDGGPRPDWAPRCG